MNLTIHIAVIIGWIFVCWKFGKASRRFEREFLICQCHPVRSFFTWLIWFCFILALVWWVGTGMVDALNHFFPL